MQKNFLLGKLYKTVYLANLENYAFAVRQLNKKTDIFEVS